MKKVFVILVLAFVFFSCDNDDMNKEPNPYPDGVYPFEVSNVGHIWDRYDSHSFTVSWDNPADGGFKRVSFELFGFGSEWGLMFTSDGENPRLPPSLSDPVLGANKFTLHGEIGNDLKAVIKCVDKFGNVSQGVEYNFSLYD
jgi:hypothetical protein